LKSIGQLAAVRSGFAEDGASNGGDMFGIVFSKFPTHPPLTMGEKDEAVRLKSPKAWQGWRAHHAYSFFFTA
jgi:hypothetical protein